MNERIKKLRKALDLTQQAFTESTGTGIKAAYSLCISWIMRWINGSLILGSILKYARMIPEFADRIGIRQNTIAKYETNRGTPTTSVISLIVREFNVSEKWLRTVLTKEQAERR